MDTSSKPTNPKDAIAGTRVPLHLVPSTLEMYAALAFLEGATKYGSYNWRRAGVRASVYRAAMDRHMIRWWNGEDDDPITHVPHLASIIASAAIILDSKECNKLTDDRPPKIDTTALIARLEPVIARVKEIFASFNPRHHYESDPPDPEDKEVCE